MLVVEVFAGSARVTAAWKLKGLKVADPWDTLYGVRFDLTEARSVRRLFNLLSSGHVCIVWWGTPCVTFTGARRWDGGPRPLRDINKYGDNRLLHVGHTVAKEDKARRYSSGALWAQAVVPGGGDM